MKKFFLFFTGFIFSLALVAQGKSGDNGKDKSKKEKSATQVSIEQKEKEAKQKQIHTEHNKKIWGGTSDKGGKVPVLSKNQPAKVSAAFQSDYPNAGNVSWYKYRGDWTASFGNGLFMSTAVYHANGTRRDTRTPVTRNEMPRNVIDAIFKRNPEARLEDNIRIEVPNAATDIFRIKDIIQGKPTYFYFDSNGQPVKYNY